ncbi:MAG: SIS domain-containing protein [Mariprofundales bacterium]
MIGVVIQQFILNEIAEAAALIQQLHGNVSLLEQVDKAAKLCITALREGGRIIFAGNGGSAADAQHLAAELVGKFYHDRMALSSIALNTDTSMLTAISNDYGFEHIFERQLEANARDSDIFIALSTSGNSKNLLRALNYCRTHGIITIGMTGKGGGDMASLCDVLLAVPSTNTPRIQEAHTVLGHALCATIEDVLRLSK